MADFGWVEARKYPVRNQHELDAAARLIGKAPESRQQSIRKRITGIAKRRGLDLPDSWKSGQPGAPGALQG
jgi:hypothetical protein